MRTVQFGERKVGDGQPVFITFEAGPTHDGLRTAETLVEHAAKAGADAVKFQILDPDLLVADRKLPFSYEVLVDRVSGQTETVTEPLYDILCRRCMPADDWRALKKRCDELNLAFFATVAFEEDIQLLEELGCHSIKIASSDVNYLDLIRRVARTGMCVQLDTGSATIGEIELAVDAIRSEGNDDIIIHQCPSGYPARLESINLRIITTLRQMFDCPIAFSDHTPGRDMDIAAVAMGASLVEKTISLDRCTRSIEHIMSLEPHDMKAFVDAVRELEIALGGPRRILHEVELERRTAVRRSLYLQEDAKRGERLADLHVVFRRPGDGVTPELFAALAHRKIRCDLKAGSKISIDDVV